MINDTYILWRIKQQGYIIIRFDNDKDWTNNIDHVLTLLKDNGYTVSTTQIKARIAYTIHNHNAPTAELRKVRTYQDFDIPSGKTWATVWDTYSHNLPSGIQLWLTHPHPLGIPELIALWIKIENNAPLNNTSKIHKNTT